MKEKYMLILPLQISITNIDNQPADVSILFSMKTKQPSLEDFDKKQQKKSLAPGQKMKCYFQSLNPEKNVFPHTIFICVQSERGFNA